MSNLAHEGDDHPDAAAKHLDDATALLHAIRYDGAGYLAGYVLECAFKTLIIVEEIARSEGLTPATLAAGLSAGGSGVASGLQSGVKKARTLKHDLNKLSQTAVALASKPGAATAAYLTSPVAQSIYENGKGWTETLRYAGVGAVDRTTATAWVGEARMIFQATIAKMRRDGVLF